MLRKKILSFTMLAVMSVSLILTGCQGSTKSTSAKTTTINFYSGGSDNVRVTWEKVIKEFSAKNPDVKVNLQFIASGPSSQAAVDKLIASEKAGQKETDIDVVEVSDNEIARLFKEAGKDSVISLSKDKIPNLKDVKFQSSVAQDKALVFRGTTVVLAYNSDKIKDVPKTDKELYDWIKKNPGRFAYNDPSTGGSGASFVISSIYNSLPEEAILSNDEKWTQQWNTGINLLKELHPYMYKASGKVQYPSKNQGTLDLLANGQVDMIPAWADMTLNQLDKGTLPKSTKITQITPSLNGGVQALVIPSKSKNQEAAAKFLNFVDSVDGQKIFVESQKAIPVIDSSKLPKETVTMLAGLEIKTFRPYTIGALDKAVYKRWQDEVAALK
ncbi:extracellular solute-binding protein [Clostridium sp. DJ247]|uniref:extracellular solute-binding protein n=1 Tax=Clostridium sp. DJ247 TaxID=2726188 RepID=UPI00162757FC|nr:extracellular solute-binding protein [Clostridium sp. DJ247]MBC2581499.1 extracellular solute-binding protein [Clostridium sp. DJ247]